MKGFKLSLNLALVIEILLTSTLVFPLYCLSITNYIFDTLNYPDNVENIIISVGYVLLYTPISLLLFVYRESDLSVTYLLFSLIHYFVISQILYIFFAKDINDGQAILLIYKYCFIASITSFLFGLFWAKTVKVRSQ